jgi:aspartyl protease family protein
MFFMLRLATIAGIGLLSAVDAAHALMDKAALAAPLAAAASAPASGLRGVQPPETASLSSGDAELTKSPDGHFWAQADVQGTAVRFLVDTGATTVALTGEDARRLGIDPQTLAYDTPVRTANGESRAARVRLASLSVGGARVQDVDAMVVREGLPSSLLGMSYLGRLSRLEATPETLILRP